MTEKPPIPTRYTETLRFEDPASQFDAFTKLRQWQQNGQAVLRGLGVEVNCMLGIDTAQQPPLHSITVILQPHPFIGAGRQRLDYQHFEQVLNWAQKPICAQDTVPGILPPRTN